MPARKQKQKIKYRGSRFHGAGNVKNRRGSGNRGGRGNAGLHKHKFSYVTAYMPDYFGKKGFVRPHSKRLPVVHLFELNRSALLGKLEKKDGKFLFEFKGKILSTGSIDFPLLVRALCWSKRTEEKIKKAGGEITAIQ